jgi:hypothetical protein
LQVHILQVHVLQVHVLQVHVLQDHVLQVHVLQVQSIVYKSSPEFTSPVHSLQNPVQSKVQSMFYNMPNCLLLQERASAQAK